MKKLVVVMLMALATVALAACGSSQPQGTFNQPSTQTSSNSNGLVFSLNLAQLSENINYTTSQIGADIPTIDSLEKWTLVSQNTDDNDAPYTYRMTDFANNNETPSFIAAVYDNDNTIMEARVSWDSTSAVADQETFGNFAVCELISLSGLDQDTAKRMFDTVQASPYTNKTSDSLTYAYYGHVRCYYMVNSGYHLFVVEPFSTESKTNEEEAGNFVYTEVTPAGVPSGQEPSSTSTTTTTDSSTGAGDAAVTGTDTSAGDAGSAAAATSTDDAASTGGNIAVTTTGQ